MQRRRSERISINLPATVILAGKSYKGHIINVSEDGVGSAVTASVDNSREFVPVHDIALHFSMPSGKTADLRCELAWFARNASVHDGIIIGMRIIDPPLMYKVFVKSLYDAALKEKSKDQLISELLETRRKLSDLQERSSAPQGHIPFNSGDICNALVESTDDSIYIVDREYRYRFMNQKHLSRLALSSEQCIGLPYSNFHSNEDAVEFSSKADEVFRSGASVRYEQKSSNDGKYYLRTLSPIKDSEGKILAVTVISKNITDRKLAEELLLNSKIELEKMVGEGTESQAELNQRLNREIEERRHTEEALKKSSEDWRITFDSTKDMILMLDQDMRVIKANRATSEFIDMPFNRIIGSSAFDLFGDMDIVEDQHPLKKMNRSGKHEESDIYLKGKDIWVLASADPIIREKDEISGAVYIVRDITEQKNLHIQLLQAQKMESIGRLAGGIAHDFNNLLSAIIGYTELTIMKLPDPSPLRDYLTMVKNAGEKAAELTRRLLAFSRKQLLKMQSVNINSIIESSIKMMSRMVMEDVLLEFHTSPSIKPVLADPVQIEQILMNLIVNARDAMPNGGKLIIETSDVYLNEDYIIRHENVKPGPYVLLSVSDTGIGMSKKVQQRIFEPFFTTKALGEGTGLGLATVYGIVKQHNGYIYVYSEIGKGTTFKIYLPSAVGAEAVQTDKAAVQLMGGSESILVVDDDSSIRNLIKEVLKPLGYRLSFARDGEEAISIADQAEEPIEVLLTDIVMPNMNGRDLADAIIKKYPDMKVIFMSGYTNESIARQGYLLESDILIQKPLSPRSLTTRLRQILGSPK